MVNTWSDSVKAATALGTGGGSSRSKKRKSKVLTAAHFRRQAEAMGATGGGVDDAEMPEIAKRALKGEFGAKRAETALENIRKSDMSKDEKKKWREFYENGGETPGGDSLLHQLTHNPVTDAMGTGLMLIDKPKRVVVAGVEELGEALGQLDENDRSFKDNVLEEADYGFGDVVQQAIDTDLGKGGVNGELAELLNSKWGKRAVGLVGDIALDPTTYIGAGVVAKGVKGGTEGTELAVKGGARLTSKDVARRLAQEAKAAQAAGKADEAKSLTEVAAAVLKRGTSAASADELAQVGAEGGLRFAGQKIVGQDNWRKVTQVGAPIKEALGDSAAMRGVRRVTGDDSLRDFRQAMRSKDSTPAQVIDSLLAVDAKRGAKRVANRLGVQSAVELEDLLTRGRNAKLTGDVLHGAVTGDLRALEAAEKAAPGLAGEFQRFFAKVRVEANRLGADEWIKDSGADYAPRYLSDEAVETIAAKSSRPSSKAGARGFQKKAAAAGDEFGDEILGSPELHARFSEGMVPDSRAAIGAQVEGLLREWNPELSQVYSNDMFTDAPRYLKGVASQAAVHNEARRLAESGVAVRPRLDLEAELAKAEAKLGSARQSLADAEPGTAKFSKAQARVAELQPRFDSFQDAARMARAPSDAMVQVAQARLQQVQGMAGVPGLPPAKAERLAEAVELRTRSVETLQRLAVEADPQARSFLALNAQADELAAQVAEGGFQGVPVGDFVKAMRDPANSKMIGDVLGDAFTSMAEWNLKDYQLSKFHMEAMVKATEVAKDPNAFLRFVDQANRFFKTYAILSPGFHVRNSMGAMFNNYVAGVSMKSYNEVGLNLKRFRKGGLEAVQADVRPIFKALDEAGFFADNAQVTSELGEFGGRETGKLTAKLGKLGNVGPVDNPVTRLSRETGDRVERFQRTVLAYDRMRKGSSLDEAWDAVSQMHFDYSDLSKVETGAFKRVIPFWTWTSRNFPLQLEMVYRQPKAYQRFGAVKNALTDEDGDPELVPSWIKDNAAAIHTGGDDYLTLDLPFTGIDEQTRGLTDNGPMALLQNASPIWKTPLEVGFGKQAFNGIPITDKRTAMPHSWSIVPGLVPILKGTGMIDGDQDSDGNYLISNKSGYIIEQALPLAGRARRLAPSEKKYQQRALASWLSFFGVGYRQVTDADKQNETWKRGDTLTNRLDRFKETQKQDDE